MISESATMAKAEMLETDPYFNGMVGTHGLLPPLRVCAWQQKAVREPGYCLIEHPLSMFGPCDHKEDHLCSVCLEFHSRENLCRN